jgi:hypothetical protein
MPEDTTLAIYNYQPATNTALATALAGLRDTIRGAAQANLDMVLAQDDGFTETERQSMRLIEELRLVNGLDLAAVLHRAQILREIESTNAIANHPNGYASMQEMAQDQGISTAELSQTLALANYVFPYVQEHMGIAIAQLWEQIGKSKLRELVPVLVSIITGEESATATVRTAVERILNDTAATLRTAGEPHQEEDVRRAAVEELIENGINLTTRQLRQHIRPERTEPIEGSIVTRNGHRVVVLEIEDDGQMDVLVRKMGGSLNTQTYQMPADARLRQQTALRTPGLREIMRMLEA